MKLALTTQKVQRLRMQLQKPPMCGIVILNAKPQIKTWQVLKVLH